MLVCVAMVRWWDGKEEWVASNAPSCSHNAHGRWARTAPCLHLIERAEAAEPAKTVLVWPRRSFSAGGAVAVAACKITREHHHDIVVTLLPTSCPPVSMARVGLTEDPCVIAIAESNAEHRQGQR